ncbi:MAG TPA: UDP-2,3-diacylglucosamine diphosphatase [Chthoniobacteraceae bacterium]|nr:UDP-2,3-diacylglucosamine diphosphatase [Chthoniobacteraceae bacterium]
MNRYRTAWISDLHLGTRGCNAEALLYFLRDYEFETLYLVGDLIDIWQLRRGIYWPQSHSDVIQKILRKGRKGTHIIYIPGNHDEFVSGFFGAYGNIMVEKQAIHETADKRRLLIMHGHELDTVVQNIKWLAYVGDFGYQLLLKLNRPVNFVRKLFGREYWSLSAYVKKSVKNAVSFIGQFEEAIVRYSKEYKVDGVVCGHIHSPVIRKIENVDYYNSGDWVESCSVLLEDYEGKISLLTNVQPPATEEGTPPGHADDDEPAPTGPVEIASRVKLARSNA